MHLLEIISLVSLAFWVFLILDRKRWWPGDQVLPEVAEEASEVSGGSIVALVPARNEAEVLIDTLPSLLRQEGIDLKVLVVDDGSTDGTAEVARRVARDQGAAVEIEVVPAGPRQKGWSGKVHALHCGFEKAMDSPGERPEWLLLTDADIWHRPDSVRALLLRATAAGRTGPFDLVSVMARLRARGFWERLIVPPFVFFFQLLYPFRRVAERDSRVAAAAGGCVLVRRTALESAGGFASIAAEIIDDVALGRAVKISGGAVWLGLDPGIVSLRAYPRLGDLWRMISRTAFTQLNHRWDLLVATLLALGVFLVSPAVVLAWVLGHSGAADSISLLRAGIWASLAWALNVVLFLPAVRHHGVPLIYAASLPLAGVLFGLMTVDSAFQDLLGRGPTWRGRSYDSSRQSGPPSR